MADRPSVTPPPAGPKDVRSFFKTDDGFAKPKTPKRLPFQSKKRRDEQERRAEIIRLTHKRSGGKCEAREFVPEVECAGRLDCDERIGRGVYPGAHLDIDVTMSCCRRHHDWIGANPREANERGLHLKSWERPTTPGRLPFPARLFERVPHETAP